MQIDRILGNVGVLYVGAYNSSTQYEYLNCVTYNGSSYVCVNQNGVTGVTPGTTNDWQLSAQKGDTGGQGIQGEQGIQGATGNGIQSITKTSSNGLTDTYTILFTDGSSTTFEVENGKGISSIEKTSTEDNVDTYTITYNDDTTSTFTVTNGEVTNEELQQALAQERVISDGKYARALKTPVTDVKSTQIYAENDVVGDLVIKGAELTQTVTEQSENIILLEDYPTTNNNGIDVTIKDNKITLIGTATADINLQLPIKYKSKGIITGDMCLGYITSGDLSNGNGNLTLYSTTSGKNIGMYFPKAANSPLLNYAHRNVEDFQINYINIYIAKNSVADNIVIDFTLANVASLEAGIPFTPNSPSLDFPSEVQVASEQNISIRGNNMCKSYTNANSTQQYTAALYIDADLKPSTKYTISFLTPDFEGNYYRAEELTADWFVVINNGKRQSFTFTTRADISNAYKKINDEYVYILFKITLSNNPPNFSEIMLVEGDTDVPYEPYYGHDVNIPLTNNSIGNYFDVIDRENNVQNKVIQELILTGDEDYYYSSVYNNIYQYNLNISNPSLSKDDFIVRAKSNYFKGIERKNSWLYDNTVTTEAKKIRFMTSQYATVEDFKAKIKELYNAGTPVKVYYVAETPTTNQLSEEVQTTLSNFKLYQDLNNIAIDGGSMSFIYNKSLSKTIEEMQDEIQSKDTLIQNLTTRVEALEQVQINSVT